MNRKPKKLNRIYMVWMLVAALVCTGLPAVPAYAADDDEYADTSYTAEAPGEDAGSATTGKDTDPGSKKDDFESDVNIYSSYNYLPIGTYDSADTAIIKHIDFEERNITLYNTIAAKTYTLLYDGTTYVSDKYGTPMSIDQLSEGTIVNVNFYKATRQLVDIQISPDAWTYDHVTRYDLGGINSTATIGDRTYALTKGVQVFSKGKQTDLENIVDGDVITVSGLGYDIYSIRVESGHGYVRLSGDEALVGGWLEIGGALITKVTEPGMLLTVPEGEYTVTMYNDNSSSVKQILVESGQEILLDCSEITAPVDTFGRILFHVTPATATLKLDGEIKDISGVIRTEYGIHEIEVSAPGYDTLQRYINVGNELAEITVILDESVAYTSGNSSQTDNGLSKNSASDNSLGKKKTSANSSSANSSKDKKKTVTTSKVNRVYVYAPENAEVYVDGLYAGLIPMSFKKTQGAHTIVLKRDGYQTRSYTIYVYDDGEDMSISFSELIKEGEDEDTGNTGKDDTDTGKTGNDDTGKTGKDDTGKDDTGKEDTGKDDTGTGTGENGQDTGDDKDKPEDGSGTGEEGKDNGSETGNTDTGENGTDKDTGDTGETGTGTGSGESGSKTGDDSQIKDGDTGDSPGKQTDPGTGENGSETGSSGADDKNENGGSDTVDPSGSKDGIWKMIGRWFT